MYRKPSRRKELIKLAAVYTLMISAILIIATLIVFFVLGFRLDTNNGQVEQYALMQFDSTPSGAIVTVNGEEVGSKTPTKASVSAGQYKVTIKRDGYNTWSKTVYTKAGAITWLNYALLVPSKITIEPVAEYELVYASLASPEGHDIIVQSSSSVPTFSLVDLSFDKIRITDLTIPASLYSEASVVGATHTFNLKEWDKGGRYVLIKHNYGDKYEWIVMDTQNIATSKNVSQLFNVEMNDIQFSGSSGNSLYALSSKDIRKLNLSAATISRPLVSKVTSFDVYDESNVITFVGSNANNPKERTVGIYREGDDESYIIRTVASDATVPLNITTARYFNDDYIAIAEGLKVDILTGSYPNSKSDVSTSMKAFSSFDSGQPVNKLSFSPNGEYVFVQTGPYFANYDMEYKALSSSVVDGTGETYSIKWLDDNHIWSDRGGKLTIRDFDNTNVHEINSVFSGQDVTLAHNGRYLYSINKVASGYQLQRVRMILP